ncbi:MAG: hypothetical protein ACRCWQ_10955 [Bacilli bacterium]
MNVKVIVSALLGIVVFGLCISKFQEYEQQIDEKNQTIRALVTHVDEQVTLLNQYTTKTNQITEDEATRIFKLESMKNRTKTLLAKPEITEALIEKSFSTFEERMSCITGNDPSCWH